MERVIRYLEVVWVVIERSAARAWCRGRDAFGGRVRCACVLAGKGAAE